MKFQEIRSATAIVTFGGVRFLVDPWLGDKGTIPPIPGSPNPDLHKRFPLSHSLHSGGAGKTDTGHPPDQLKVLPLIRQPER